MTKKYKFLLAASSLLVASSSVLPFVSPSVVYAYDASTGQFDSSSIASFVADIGPSAKKASATSGIYPSIMIAQAILESGHGASVLSKDANNLFGIKAEKGYVGDVYNIDTKENIGNTTVQETISANFRKYASQADSITDHASFFTSTSYRTTIYKGIKIADSSCVEEALTVLPGKYATDVLYGSKLLNLINTYNLRQYDPVQKTCSIPSVSNPHFVNGAKYHTVKPGDFLTEIANTYNISLEELKQANNISDNLFLKIGRELSIPVKETDSNENETTPDINDITPSIPEETPVIKPSEPAPAPSVDVSSYGTNFYFNEYGYKYHTVRKSEYLNQIGKLYGLTAAKIKDLNGLTKDSLKIGQKLIIGVPSVSIDKNGNKVHKTQRGEYLSLIAKYYKVTTKQLIEWNKLTKTSLKVNQQLIVTAPKKATTTNKNTYYTVVKGDTLYKIATKKKTTVAKITSLNKLKNSNIKVGQKLIISKKTVASKTNTKAPSTSNKTTIVNNYYTVAKGDTLYKIAKKKKTTVAKITSLNKLKNSNIKVGQKLIVGQTVKK